jgi:hypothetical protein
MKRWIISVLLAIFLNSPAVSGAADDQSDQGKATFFDIPFFKIPLGANSDSKATKEKKEAEEKAKKEEKKEKEDKKVDDAIKKAWGDSQ